MQDNDYIYFYIPGIADIFEINFMLLKRMREYPDHFYPNIKIGSIFGTFPGAKWNGGRLSTGFVEEENITKALDFYKGMKIPVRWTWTNPALIEDDLKDEFCNHLTKMGETGLNEVLVSTDMMENYIRTNYPKYSIISSTTKRITDIDALNAELEKDYKLVVIDYDFNNKWDLLDKIKYPEKCEILVNAVCAPNCPFRKKHYEIIGRLQRGEEVEQDARINGCMSQGRRYPEVKKLGNFVSREDIWEKYVPRGFRHFKIEGRENGPLPVLEWYLYYMVKPEWQDEERSWFYLCVETFYLNPTIPVKRCGR